MPKKENHFDQASRYLVKLDPKGFFQWLLAEEATQFVFQEWLDTRTLPFPGQPDRTCDTVAELADLYKVDSRWALPLEFQTKPDPEMLGRWLEYLGRLWREIRPRTGGRYQVAAALVNLTGKGESSADMSLGTQAQTLLKVREINLCQLNAATLLPEIAAGNVTMALLPFIPLMHGGNTAGIMEQWKQVAETEMDRHRRGDYAGLTLVFAELAGTRQAWNTYLEGWNVEQSQQVLEWQAVAEKRGFARGEQKGKAEDIVRLLERRFKRKVPAALVTKIKTETDLDQLTAWFDVAITIPSVKEFGELIRKQGD